jgi:DNA polymerase I-like protein with 3'-5' exonuclease and polymerase domains
MNLIAIDFETYFTDAYNLKKCTIEEYIRSPQFEALGCAVRDQQRRWLDYEELEPHTAWVPHDKLPDFFESYDWERTGVLAHHAQFDLFILNHWYKKKPKFIFDTLSMARLLIGNHLSVSLDSLARHFNLAPKSVPYQLFKGRHWHELSPDVQRQVATGACHDVGLTWKIFEILRQTFPSEEYPLVDATCRMFTEPSLRGDINLLAKLWEDENHAKKSRLERLAVGARDLASSDKFAALLSAEGIAPETKAGKNGPIYAFAKTDQFMRDLLEHDSERVRTLAEARLGEKSTLLQTRAETLGWMARRGPMPVYLRYAGAHTTRWSGGDGANWQNFKRGSAIRKSILAPEGCELLVPDLEQIECRILCYLAGQHDYIEKFAKGIDPYIGMASKAYGYPVTKENPKERGTGKQLVLSCGYQAGTATIQNTARLGIYGPPVAIDLATAETWKQAYRKEFWSVVRYWGEADTQIPVLANGGTRRWGPMNINSKKIYGPGGTMLHYDTLARHVDEETGEALWRYRTRYGWTKLYSGKLVENVVQWLARIVLSQAMLRLQRRGYKMVTCSHDEVVIVVANDGKQEYHRQQVEHEMSRTPDWLPGLPLACETVLGERYAK